SEPGEELAKASHCLRRPRRPVRRSVLQPEEAVRRDERCKLTGGCLNANLIASEGTRDRADNCDEQLPDSLALLLREGFKSNRVKSKRPGSRRGAVSHVRAQHGCGFL